VVAATCVGTATSPLLAGHTFDLAIVDEAGQISTPNLLVPLVRAHRSVLVGDHHQLPPFLDHEVQGWVKQLPRDRAVRSAAVREISELLHKSAFERLYEHVDPTHRVMLATQRRMPKEIADFVSQAFYRGQLRTRHAGGIAASAFNSPFAMIDTVDEPLARRSETSARQQELFGESGYVNHLEAELITSLIARHARHYRDWAVIVPYRAQAALVTKLLTEQLGDARGAEENVGSVDSFQGGEKDLIVYGFTRSNSGGRIGFLSELRRINVAITRAKQQLVLVGDSSTLQAAEDDDFAKLMRAMTDYLTRFGDVCPSRQLDSKLDRLGGNPS
jgi:superfamily I DNA and/or RNA helicase